MKLLRTSWLLGKWCADCVRDTILVFLWLALGACLLVQVSIIANHQLPMPDWMLRKIEARLNTAGLRVQIGHASLDTAGRVQLENVQLTPLTFDSPIASVESLRIRLRPLSLLAGQIEPLHIRIKGLSFQLPAMFSASGQAEAILNDLDIALKPSAEKFSPSQCSGRMGNLTFDLHGAIENPGELFSKPGKTSNFRGLSPAFLKLYIDYARQLSRLSAELAAFDHPYLSAELVPSGIVRITFTSRKLDADLARFAPAAGRLSAENISITTSLSLGHFPPDTISLQIHCTRASSAAGASVGGIQGRINLKLPADNEPLAIASSVFGLSAATFHSFIARDSFIELKQTAGANYTANLFTEALDGTWQAEAMADTDSGRAAVRLNGTLTNEIIQNIAPHTGIEPDLLLKLSQPAPLSLAVNFSDNWKLNKIRAHVDSGPVIIYTVPFNAIGGDIDCDLNQLFAYNLYARQGENHATGTYWMNLHDLRYRFLLSGQLRPMGIAGFFDTWWGNFWKFFDFTTVAPTADVDVGGSWHGARKTAVFVSVDAPRSALNGVNFDRVRTTLFIRPHFYHALSLTLDREDKSTHGSFTRVVDFDRDADDLKTIDFDMVSNMDLRETARIFGSAGTETVAPFHFAQPPDLHLIGHIDGPASERGAHREIQIDLASQGAFHLYDFPLNDLSFNGSIRDDEIILSNIQVKFASGQGAGSARIYGKDTDRHISFDGTLKEALLGEAINTLETYAARSRGEPAPAQSRFQQQNAQGRLNLDLAAQGNYDDLFSYFGHGHMELTKGQLAQVNLLGSLSVLLGKTPIFRFTSLQLKEARCSFVLERDKITFPDLKITGTNAIIDTAGIYQLDTKLMDFTARLYPFGQGRNPFASAAGFLLVPLTNALELKLSGSIDQPHWRFTYGPTNFLYNLTGANPNESFGSESNAPDGPRKLPQPYLRH